MQKISTSWGLIWLDIKSWLVSTVLMFLPLALGAIVVYINNLQLNAWGVTILAAIGSLFKLFQKWLQSSSYIVNQ